MTLNRAAAILELASPIAEAIPVLGTPVKSVLDVTAKVLKYAGEVKSNKQKTLELAEHAARLSKALTDRLEEVKNESTSAELERLGEHIGYILELLAEIMSWTQKRTQQNQFKRAWRKADDLDDLGKWRRRLDDVYQGFMLESQVGMDRKLEKIVSATERALLMSLEPVFTAHYDSLTAPPGCLPGTRIEVLDAIMKWCAQPSSTIHIYWLAGHAGTGKSAIARTLSKRLAASSNNMVVTFFASRDSEERRNPIRMLHTMVHELAFKRPLVRAHVVRVLESRPDIIHKALNEQITQLMLEPLHQLAETTPIFLVIDALDECLSTRGVEGGTLIHDLASVLGSLPIKLVVTSRLEQSLRTMFRKLPSQNVELHEIEGDQVSHDVRLIFEKGFEAIVEKHAISDRPWPTETELGELIKRTGRLIIFASTVLKFIDNNRYSAQKQLNQVLMQNALANPGHQYRIVDELYLNVLEAAARDNGDTSHVDEALCARLQVLLGVVVLLYIPMSIPSLAQLMGLDPDDVCRDVRALSAVLLVGPDVDDHGAPLVHIFHPSFRDFLLDRCSDPRFSIDTARQHHRLSICCLRILNHSLKYDICDIRDPTIPHSKVTPSLTERLQRHVPLVAQYSCQFWLNHLTLSDSPDAELASFLRAFVLEHLLHWMELLGLMGKTGYACQHLPDAVAWSKGTKNLSNELDVPSILYDSWRMVQIYQRALDFQGLQVYYSGMLSIPRCALHKQEATVGKKKDSAPQLTSARASHWPRGALVMEHADTVYAVAFSPDGKQIVSGSDQTVQLWDAESGHEISKLEGHTGSVLSVAFSPDGKQIASGSFDQTVRLWDVNSGYEVRKFEGHNKSVISVAFSLDGRQITSGSFDQTVRLWDAESGRNISISEHSGWVNFVAFSPDCKQIASGFADRTWRLWDSELEHGVRKFEGHSSWVESIAFSPNGKQIASGSFDQTVRLWDAGSGYEISKLEGHTGSVRSVAFSPDGKQIASGSFDQTVRLWDAESGRNISIFEHSGWVNSVAFSPDGKQIASGSNDRTLRLWDSKSGRHVSKLGERTSSVLSIAFSQDGKQVAVGSVDHTVRLWDAESGHEVNKFEGHTGWVRSIAFSPNGKQIASGSDDNTLRLWDAESGHEVSKFEGHTSYVLSIAFSPDGKQIATGSYDRAARLWNAESGHEILQLEGHGGSALSVTFSPDGKQIVTGSSDNTVRLWDAESGHEVNRFEGHTSWVRSVAFSPDGKQIASGSDDKTVRFWDAESGRSISKFEGNYDWVQSVTFSHDNKYVTARSCDASLQFWPAGDAATDRRSLDVVTGIMDPGIAKGDIAFPLALSFDRATGWIMAKSPTSPADEPMRNLCWLSADLRGEVFAIYKDRVIAIASSSTYAYQLTIIDMGPMLDMLRNLAAQ